jgi:hypothetical protein
LDAVRGQIESSIRTYFLWDDLVSALTLAGAAERVLSDRQRDDGLFGVDSFSITSMINLYIKEEYHREAVTHFRRDYDFFRHADRKPQDHYAFTEEWVDFLLLITIGAFQFLGHETTQDMRTFVYWFSMKYPRWLKEGTPFTQMIMATKLVHKYISKREYYMMRHQADFR